MRKLRVLHLTMDLSQVKQSIPSQSFGIIHALEKKGHANRCLYVRREKPTGIKSTFQKKKINALWLGRFPLIIWPFVNEIERFNPDVIFFHHCSIPFLLPALILAKLLGKKTLMFADVGKHNFPKIKPSLPAFFWTGPHYLQFTWQLRLVDGILCYTAYEKKLILSQISGLDEKKLYVFPIGINPKLEQKIDNKKIKKENAILTVAQWSERKNLHGIVRVFRDVAEKVDCKLIVVGPFINPRYEREIKRLVKELKLKGQVLLVGPQVESLPKYYSKSKIFFLPSLETFGVVFIEALTFGLPIVARKYPVTEEIISDGKTGFLRNSSKEQGEVIIELLKNQEQWQEMHENCIRASREYNWDTVVERFEDIVGRL